MARLLGLLLLLGLGWLIVRQLLGTSASRKPRPQDDASPQFEKTVRCARCGVHMPLSLAYKADDGHVCGDPDCTARTDKASHDRSR